MISLDLTAAERKAYLAALESSHRIDLEVLLLSSDEDVVASLTAPASYVQDGAVQYDATAAVSRSLSLTLLDPLRRLHLDPTSPADGALFADNLVQVRYRVYVAELLRWVEVPVFRGVLTSLQRHGAILELEAQGKEALAQEQHRANTSFRLRKGMEVMTAIRRTMAHAGETRFRLPNVGLRLNKTINVGPQDELWKVVVGGREDANGDPIPSLMRRAGHRHAFYNGRGELVVRRRSRTPQHTFREGMNTGEVQLTYDALEFINRVVVTGAKPKGARRRVRGVASLPASNPLSAHALRRGGVPRHLTVWIEAPGLKTDRACLARAREELRERSTQGLAATFEALPIPHLEELERVALVTADGARVEFNLRQWTLPLTAAGGLMSIGFQKQVRPRRPRRGGT